MTGGALAAAFEGPMTLREGQAALRRAFAAAGLETPDLDARILVAARLKLDPVVLVREPDRRLAPQERATLRDAGLRRLAGEPVARILGFREFWGLPFLLSAETLVPRPDSETLVSAVLGAVDRTGGRARPLRILDLGTGTGCLLIALLHELREARGLGIDTSLDAVETARLNAERIGVSARAAFVTGDWAEGIVGPFDIVVSNPPYIESAVIGDLQPEVRDHDPHLALDGGADGLDAYRIIAAELPRLLAPDGFCALEIGAGQRQAVSGLLAGHEIEPIEAHRDLGGHDRVLLGWRRA